MNALTLLKDDHNKVRGLFNEVKVSESDKEKRELFKKIKAELEVHTHIEETIFYPAVREKKELAEIVFEGVQEHHVVDVLIREITALTEGSDVFDPKLTVLMENVEHHAQEEEGEMFPKVEESFSEATLGDLGEQMEKAKRSFNKASSANAN